MFDLNGAVAEFELAEREARGPTSWLLEPNELSALKAGYPTNRLFFEPHRNSPQLINLPITVVKVRTGPRLVCLHPVNAMQP